MKKYMLFLVVGITISYPVFSSESKNANLWNYVELSRVIIDSDHGGDGDGFGVDAKYSLNDNFFISGIYQNYSFSASDHDRYLLGFGGRYEVSKQLIPFVQIEHVTVDSSSRFRNSSINYWILGVGISGGTNDIGYKLALTHYEAISNTVRNDSGYYAEVYYLVNNQISLGVEIESINNDGALYNYAFRYHF